MSRAAAAPPAGYVALDLGDARVVCLTECADAAREAFAAGGGSLYAWAGARPGRVELRGRAPAYAVTLPGAGVDVVVRHSRHGGALATLTRDLFLPPTRAPRELATALRLRAAGVRTPQVVAYAVYRARGGLRRADVATRLVAEGRDLAAVIADAGTPRTRVAPAAAGDAASALAPWVRPAGLLLHSLARAGAVHPDLNLKNVLLTPRPPAAADDGASDNAHRDAYDGWVLDVDVVRLPNGVGDPARAADDGRVWRAAEANWARLARSLGKWRDERGLAVHDADLDALREYARRGPAANVALVWLPRTTAVHAS